MTNQKTLVWLDRITASEVRFKDIEDRALCVFNDTGVEFEFIPVNRGWAHTGEKAYYFSRVPARQWKRGISTGNTTLWEFGEFSTFADASHEMFSILSKISQSHLDGSFYRWLGKEITSCALSKHFALNSSDKLFFFDQPVGKFSREENSFILDTSVIYQELMDLIRRRNLGVGVV